MKDLTKWGVYEKPYISASGQYEQRATFMTKTEAEWYLRQQVPLARERRSRFTILRLPTKDTT